MKGNVYFNDGTNLLGWVMVIILFGLASVGLLFLILLGMGGEFVG